MKEEKLLTFITKELNENNKYANVIPYDDEYFNGGKNIRITFRRDHKALYARLLHFCADNEITIIKTQPGTYETILRLESEGEA